MNPEYTKHEDSKGNRLQVRLAERNKLNRLATKKKERFGY